MPIQPYLHLEGSHKGLAFRERRRLQRNRTLRRLQPTSCSHSVVWLTIHPRNPCQYIGGPRRSQWHHQGAQSCAHWLSWRIGLDPATAREKVRVARALGQLPVLDAALAAGRISYAKVRAITRVATPETEERLVEMAAFATGAQLERICRRYRGLRGQFRREEAERNGEIAVNGADTERMICLSTLANGMVRLEATLQPDEADLVMKAI